MNVLAIVALLVTLIMPLEPAVIAELYQPQNVYQSPYINITTPDVVVPVAHPITYTVAITNYSDDEAQTVSVDVPHGMTVVDAGDFTVQDDLLTWSGVVSETEIVYRFREAAPIPYVNLAEYGVVPLCSPEIGTCANYTAALNLGALSGAGFYLYENRIDLLYISANGIVGSPFSPFDPSTAYTNTTHINQPLPLADSINHVIAPLWRDNTFLSTDSGMYAAVLQGITDAEQSLYITWHNVGTIGNDDITARYAMLIDLDGSGRIYFIYDALTATEIMAEGFTIGIENITGDNGTQWGYAGTDRPPSGFLPTPQSTFELVPTMRERQPVQLTFSLQAAEIGDHFVTARLNDDRIPFDVWDTAQTEIDNRVYLPLVVGGSG